MTYTLPRQCIASSSFAEQSDDTSSARQPFLVTYCEMIFACITSIISLAIELESTCQIGLTPVGLKIIGLPDGMFLR